MPLSASQRLGPYEVLAPLGSGGMGEVWRARDERLGREVAIKVLPDDVSSDAGRLKRFEREARAASALNHPNIVTIYDIGSVDSVSWIAMERVEGKTLREVLFAGPMPMRRLLAIAAQIADGLATAHQAGIVHRDLKPENVMVTKEGLVKILDFGLAKVPRKEAESGPSSRLPTETETSPGVVLGTVGYMSPEQAAGQPLDFRSDQFSFGSILYEMATGKRAFQEGTAVDTLSAILHEEPKPLAEITPEAPALLRWIVERCHAKDPDRRYAATRDLTRDLETLRDRTAEALVPVGREARRRTRTAVAIVTIGIGLAALLAAGYFGRARVKPRSLRFEVTAPPDVVEIDMVQISPDGKYLAFNATERSDKTRIWLRPLNGFSAHPLAETEGASRPFWSPDSRFLAFFADGKLKKIDVTGGPPQKICDADGSDGSWSPEGVILFDTGADPIYRVPAAGGTPAAVVKADTSRAEIQVGWPEFLPDGKHFLYLAFARKPENSTYRVGSLDSSETRPLMPAQTLVHYAPPGYLLFVRDGTLVAQRFDPNALKTIGEPARVAEQIGIGGYGLARFSVSREGTLAYRTSDWISRLLWFDRSGREIETAGDPGELGNPALSPRGDRLAFNLYEKYFGSSDSHHGRSSIWIRDLARGVNSRISSTTKNAYWPVWSPDGSRIVYSEIGEGRAGDPGAESGWDLVEKSTTGDEEARTIIHAVRGAPSASNWSRDGRYIAYFQASREGNTDIWILPTFGDRKPIPFVKTSFDEVCPVFSPDGKYVAYASNESGRKEIYVRTFSGAEGKWQVSAAGGDQPVWRADGKEIFYYSPERNLMAVDVSTAEGFQAGAPKLLFAMRIRTGGGTGRNKFVASADGQRFLLVSRLSRDAVVPTAVVLNWSADLPAPK